MLHTIRVQPVIRIYANDISGLCRSITRKVTSHPLEDVRVSGHFIRVTAYEPYGYREAYLEYTIKVSGKTAIRRLRKLHPTKLKEMLGLFRPPTPEVEDIDLEDLPF